MNLLSSINIMILQFPKKYQKAYWNYHKVWWNFLIWWEHFWSNILAIILDCLRDVGSPASVHSMLQHSILFYRMRLVACL